MGGPNGDVIFQQQLDPTEHTAVEELHNWLIANPNAEWKESPRFKLVEQCSEARLREILQLLAQNSSVATFRTSHTGLELKEGELIPISPRQGCSIRDGQQTYPLVYGTKMCISKKVSVEVSEGNTLYLLWKVKKAS